MPEPQFPPLLPGDRTLLEARLTLSPADRKRIHVLAVEVPPDTAALAIFFDYWPRWSRDREKNRQLIEAAIDEQLRGALAAGVAAAAEHREQAWTRLGGMAGGMRTLLNLSLHDPTGADRGRWDQNDIGDGSGVKEDLICRESASPGYVPGALPAGKWTASVEVHEILTERCELCVRAVARRATSGVPPQSSARPAPPARNEFAHPLPPGWLRGELHSHCSASDGVYAPEVLLERAQSLGLDYLALTDHNTVAGLAALDAAPLPIIPGCEITTFRGHFLSLGLREAPPWYVGERLLSSEDLAEAVRAAGGLFGLAHPYVLGDPICVGCRLQMPVRADDIDLLEVWSRGAVDPVARLHALAFLDELWRGGRRVTAVAGRDWHAPAQERAVSGQRFPATCLRARPEVGSLLSALRTGACYLSVGPHLQLELHAGGRRAGLGEELSLGAGQSASLQLGLEALEEPSRVRLLSGGHCLREEHLEPGTARLEHEGIPAGPLRVEVWGAGAKNAELLLLSSPISVVNKFAPPSR